jgi:hypothetical protein
LFAGTKEDLPPTLAPTKPYDQQETLLRNVLIKRFNKTIKQEFFDITMRKKIYSELDELQLDLDILLEHFNNERPHSRKYC